MAFDYAFGHTYATCYRRNYVFKELALVTSSQSFWQNQRDEFCYEREF